MSLQDKQENQAELHIEKAFSFHSYIVYKTSHHHDCETEVKVTSDPERIKKYSTLFNPDSISNLLDVRKAYITLIVTYNYI